MSDNFALVACLCAILIFAIVVVLPPLMEKRRWRKANPGQCYECRGRGEIFGGVVGQAVRWTECPHCKGTKREPSG